MACGPLVSFAQGERKVWRVGLLITRRVGPLESDTFGAFPEGMRELGYVEGKNLVIEWRSANGNADSLPALAAELVRMKVNVIVAFGQAAIAAAQTATSTIPIVMGTASDPVPSRYGDTLARPGSNITGLSNFSVDLAPKQLELLHAIVPKASKVAVLVNPTSEANEAVLRNTQAAAQRIGLKILPVEAQTPQGIEAAFSLMAREKVGALIVVLDAIFIQQRLQIAELVKRHRLPAIGPNPLDVSAGLLMSYGADPAELFRRAATHVDKILKGARPADLPIEQPTNVQLVVNRTTAKALGLTIPQSVLIRADRVIE